MIHVKEYHTEYNETEQASYVWSDEPLNCPACDCPNLIKKGWRRRKLILIIGTLIVFLVRRVKCKSCGKIHHVLPDTIVPYKRYDADTIEEIIEGDPYETRCEESTINRIKAWWARIRFYVLVTVASIIKECKTQITSESKLAEVVNTLANAQLWPDWSRCKERTPTRPRNIGTRIALVSV
jgi:hypothetical protein